MGPYHAQISFTINIFPTLPDGSLVPSPLTASELEELGIKPKAVFNITGFNKEDCITKIREALSKINYAE